MSSPRRERSRGAPAALTAIPGRRPVMEALRAGRRIAEVALAGQGGDLAAIADAARAADVPLRSASPDELDTLSAGVAHQGAVALAPPFPYLPLSDLASSDLLVFLDGVTDPQNLGAIARSALQAGAGGLVLPKRRSAHVSPAAEKASAGAFSWLPVAQVPNLVRALDDVARAGFWSVGLDGSAAADVWSSNLLAGKVSVVVGGEGGGLSRLVRERVDGLVRIPMHGRLDSLNASAAAAIVLFEVLRRRQMPSSG